MEKICGWCGSTEAGVAACSGCKCVQYCGTECQTSAWSRSSPVTSQVAHKEQCHLLAQVCEISARLLSCPEEKIGQEMLLVGKPVKRAASESPEKTDPRQTKQVVLSTPEDSPPSKSSETSQTEGVLPKRVRDTNLQNVLRPLSKDVLRLISLMTLLDAGSLMRASPAWRVFYEQLNWKQIILSRWSDSPAYASTVDSEEENSRRVPVPGGRGLKSIGRWLFDNSIFRLYPNVLLDRSLYAPSPDQQARIDRINRERGELQTKMLETDSISRRDLETTIRLDEETEALEYEILLNRFQEIATPTDVDTQHALMNICILYRMYEHNVALATLEGTIPDADSLTIVDQIARSHAVEIGGDDAPRSSFFPVELLSRTLETADGMPLVDVVSDAWPDETPESLIQLSRYFRYMESTRRNYLVSARELFSMELTGIANIPRALVACNNLFLNLTLRECPVWSDASFRNLSKMTNIGFLHVYGPEWKSILVDVVATCPKLNFLKFINLPPGRFSVSPQHLRESAPGSGVFGARALTKNGPAVHITIKHDGDVLEEDSLIAPPRKLPPGPFAGLSRNEHIERTIRRAFEQYSNKASGNPAVFANDDALFARLMAELRKRNLFEMPNPTSAAEYEQLVNAFCLALEASGVSPIVAAGDFNDPRNIALPFNVWFERGLEYYDNTYAVLADGTRAKAVFKTIPSHARLACQMAADKRRSPGAFPSLEELAEAMVAWRASVYNLAVYSTRSDNPRRSYCKSIAARIDEDAWKNAIRPEADFWFFYNSDSEKLTAISHELVMVSVLRSSAAKNPATQTPRVSFSKCYGDIPAWLWLLDSRIDRLRLTGHIRPYVPPQLMYHPGISTFECFENRGWGTTDNSLQWDLFRIAPNGRPGESIATPGTMMDQYHHDFFRLVIKNSANVKFHCFPPIVTENYQGGFELDTSQ